VPAAGSTEDAISVAPANQASWADLQTVLGVRGPASSCQCQRIKLGDGAWWSMPTEERAARLREETDCGHPRARQTSGLVAYLDGEPVGWCAVEPRTAYRRLLNSRIPWANRLEDKDDDDVWAVVCFVTRAGYRRRGISRALAVATVDYARRRGARALEGYPIIPRAGQDVPWGELNVGAHAIFVAAGFTEVSRPSNRRADMRIDF
jgi:GNAT superfamily N-acetyltransferase